VQKKLPSGYIERRIGFDKFPTLFPLIAVNANECYFRKEGAERKMQQTTRRSRQFTTQILINVKCEFLLLVKLVNLRNLFDFFFGLFRRINGNLLSRMIKSLHACVCSTGGEEKEKSVSSVEFSICALRFFFFRICEEIFVNNLNLLAARNIHSHENVHERFKRLFVVD
jgi:hypothetical protein